MSQYRQVGKYLPTVHQLWICGNIWSAEMAALDKDDWRQKTIAYTSNMSSVWKEFVGHSVLYFWVGGMPELQWLVEGVALAAVGGAGLTGNLLGISWFYSKVRKNMHESSRKPFINSWIERKLFLVAQQLYKSSYLFVCLFVPSNPHTNSQVHVHTQKPDQTKININGSNMAKIAAQLLYGPVLVWGLV